jgi:hypothetical protein
MRPWLARLIALFQRRRLDRELADEIAAHLEMAVADNRARGLSAEEARRVAMTAFGGVLQTEEAYRDRQGFPLLESMWQDVKNAVRSLRRSPGFAAIAILTLALGIGATTSISSVVQTLLIRPLPFPDADRLVAVFATSPAARRDTTSFLDFFGLAATGTHALGYGRVPFRAIQYHRGRHTGTGAWFARHARTVFGAGCESSYRTHVRSTGAAHGKAGRADWPRSLDAAVRKRSTRPR